MTAEDGKLFAQLTGQPKLELLPESKDHFYWKDVDAEIIFQRDEHGTVTGGIHTQAGNSIGVAKLGDQAVPRCRRSPRLCRAISIWSSDHDNHD